MDAASETMGFTVDFPGSTAEPVHPAETHATGLLDPQQTVKDGSPRAANTEPPGTGDSDQTNTCRYF